MAVQKFTPLTSVIIALIFIWSIFWKGTALWHASQNREKIWFIAIILLNTGGILEIAYLFYFSKSKLALREAKIFVKTLSFKNIKKLLTS